MRNPMGALRRAVDRGIDRLPMTIGARLKRGRFRYDPRDVPSPTAMPAEPIRVLIAPSNAAAQAWSFARALDRLDGVAARNLQITLKRDFGFPADRTIRSELTALSAPWRRRQFSAVARLTHVIVESGRPQFGTMFGGETAREIAALRSHGVRIAHLAHGSELRQPDRHRMIDEWSPFLDQDWAAVPTLASRSAAYRRLLEETDAPVFVTTPDLLLDWPAAHWSPLVVDLDRWATSAPVLERERIVVAHAPTNRVVKGTDLIEPTLRSLEDEGLIEYRRFEGVPSSQLPAEFARADVVLDQFRMGIYSAVSVEAMAAGRLVIAHLHDHTVRSARELTGLDVPILSATPATLEARLREIHADRTRFAGQATRGPVFVRAVHDGELTARVIERAFLRPPPDRGVVAPAGALGGLTDSG